MNIIKRELKANAKSLIIWSLITSAILFMWYAEFAAYYNNPEMAAILEAMPQALLDAFSMNAANITTLNGYFSTLLSFLYLILGIHAVTLGSSIIAKEQRDKTSEFLFSMPITRHKVITCKIIAATINCIIILLVSYITSIVLALRYNPDKEFFSFISLSLLATFLIQILFLSVGMFLASIIKKDKRASTIAATILFVTFIFSL